MDGLTSDGTQAPRGRVSSTQQQRDALAPTWQPVVQGVARGDGSQGRTRTLKENIRALSSACPWHCCLSFSFSFAVSKSETVDDSPTPGSSQDSL